MTARLGARRRLRLGWTPVAVPSLIVDVTGWDNGWVQEICTDQLIAKSGHERPRASVTGPSTTVIRFTPARSTRPGHQPIRVRPGSSGVGQRAVARDAVLPGWEPAGEAGERGSDGRRADHRPRTRIWTG